MPDRSVGCTPLVQTRTRKTVPITARLAPGVVAQLEETAHRLGFSRHYVLKTAVEHGLSPAVAALTAQATASQPA